MGWVSLAVFPGLLVPFIDITVSSGRVSKDCFIPWRFSPGIVDVEIQGNPGGVFVDEVFVGGGAPTTSYYCVLVWSNVDGGSYVQVLCRVPEGEGFLLIEYIKVRQIEFNFSASEAREMK
jgi:hypothetical protein